MANIECVVCVLCAQSSPISEEEEEEEGKKQMAGLPARLAFVCAKKWEKCLHSLVFLSVCGPLLLSSSPPSPIPSRPPGMEITSTKQKSPRLYYPIPSPEGQQQQLLLHANGTTGMVPCEVNAGE